jgi:hypothetical protein
MSIFSLSHVWWFSQDYCLTCKGSGVIDGMKYANVTIPAGAVQLSFSNSIVFCQSASFPEMPTSDHNFELLSIVFCFCQILQF